MSADALGGLRTSGGAHGTSADLDALDALAAGLLRAGEALAGAAVHVAGVAASPELLLTVALDPRGGGEALSRLTGCARGLADLGGRLSATAGAVSGAVASYRWWDATTAASTEALERVVARAALQGVLLPAGAAGLVAAGGWWAAAWSAGTVAEVALRARGVTAERASSAGDVAEELVWDRGVRAAGSVASVAWAAVAPAQDDVTDLGVHAVLGVTGSAPLTAGLVARVGYHQPRTASARPVGPPTRGAAPVAGVGGLISTAGRLKAETAGVTGAVDVARTPGGPGRPARVVVFLPATQEGVAAGGPNPADMETNLLAVGREATAVTDGTLSALRQAGVRPGDEVAFVGFSQGGLSALQLAADPRVRALCSPRAVVTAGSPTATQRPPGGVTVLSLEHDGDPMPALDGARNPDTPAWTTVRARTDGTPHDSESYASTGARVDASADPSLVTATAALAPFLAMDGTTTVTRFQLSRTPLPPALATPPTPTSSPTAGPTADPVPARSPAPRTAGPPR